MPDHTDLIAIAAEMAKYSNHDKVLPLLGGELARKLCEWAKRIRDAADDKRDEKEIQR